MSAYFGSKIRRHWMRRRQMTKKGNRPVDSFETDGSLPDLPIRFGNLFDLSILEMKCALFDLGIPHSGIPDSSRPRVRCSI